MRAILDELFWFLWHEACSINIIFLWEFETLYFFGKISEILCSSWILDFKLYFLKVWKLSLFLKESFVFLSAKDFSNLIGRLETCLLFVMFCLRTFHFETCFLFKFLFFPFNGNMEMFCSKKLFLYLFLCLFQACFNAYHVSVINILGIFVIDSWECKRCSHWECYKVEPWTRWGLRELCMGFEVCAWDETAMHGLRKLCFS